MKNNSKHHSLIIKSNVTNKVIFSKNFSSFKKAYKFAINFKTQNITFQIHNWFVNLINIVRRSDQNLISYFGNLKQKNNKFKYKTKCYYFDCVTSYLE